MKKKTLRLLDAGLFALILVVGSLIANTAFGAFGYRPFGGRVIMNPATAGVVCPGQGDISTSGTYGQSSLLAIPYGTRTGGSVSAGRWILGLHLPTLTPTCVLDEVPYSVYNIQLYGVSR